MYSKVVGRSVVVWWEVSFCGKWKNYMESHFPSHCMVLVERGEQLHFQFQGVITAGALIVVTVARVGHKFLPQGI